MRDLRVLAGWRLFLLWLLLLAPVGAGAAPLKIEPEHGRYDLGRHSTHLEDPFGGMTLREVLAPQAIGAWRPVQEEVPNLGYSLSAHWFRFSLSVTGDSRQIRFLEVGYPLLNHVDVYLLRAGASEPIRLQAGDSQPFDVRYFKHRNFVFPLELRPAEPLEVLVRVQTTSSAQIPLRLWHPAAFQAANERELAIYGLYGGIMLAMVAYNLFILLAVRARAYLYYVLFIATSGLLLMSMRGITFEFLWPESLWWQERATAVLAGLVPVFGGLFASSFLNLRAHSRRLDDLLRLVMVLSAAVAVLGLVQPTGAAVRMAVVVVLAWVLLVVVAGGYALWRGETVARYYLAAWGVFFIAAFLTGLYQFALVPHSAVGEYSLLLGSALETLLLSFALADRINRMRSQTEEAQRQALRSLRQYETFYQQAPYGIFTTIGRRLVAANPAAARLLGYDSPEEATGLVTDARDLYVVPEDRERMLARLGRDGHCAGFETQLRHKDGSAVWVALSVRLAGERIGGQRHLEGSVVDISERKRREQAEQARLVAEKEREAATEAARAKTAFLSNVSHEIRTPLTAIIGYGEFLLEPEVSDEQRHELARTILRSGHHLLDLVNDVLDLSKLDAGRLELEELPVEPLELLREIEAAFQGRAQRKGLQLHLRPRLPLPKVIRSDPTRLRQILYNLCGNAVKFTEAGSVAIEASYQAQAGQLCIAVTDTGIGIAPEQRERIFDPFTQGDVSTPRRYGGSGLGLSISRQLAQMLGGEIRCESEPGRGSRFELVLRVGAVEPGLLLEADGDAAETLSPPRLRGRVLYAEDNRESQRLLALLADGVGAELVAVDDGRQAVARAAQEPFDLILLDIHMPQLDGFGALARLRQHGFGGPIIALTGQLLSADRASYAAAGFSDCLPKPVTRSAFYALLERHLAAAPPAAPAPVPPRLGGSVLIIEPDPAARDVLMRLAERTGARVTAVEEGEAGLAAACAHRYELILLEKQLPGDGLALTARLRGAGVRTPIYLLSTDPDPGLAQLAAGAGCQGTVTKPFDSPSFYRLLMHYLPPPDARRDEDWQPQLAGALHGLMRAAAGADWGRTAELAAALRQLAERLREASLVELAEQLVQAARHEAPEQVLQLLEALRQQLDRLTTADAN